MTPTALFNQISLSKFFAIVLSVLLLSACSSGGSSGSKSDPNPDPDPIEDTEFDISDASSLSRAITIEDATRQSGSIPSTSSNSGLQMNVPAEVALTNNSSADIVIEVPLPSSDHRLAAVFVEIEGSGEYFLIPMDAENPGALAYTRGGVAIPISAAGSNYSSTQIRATSQVQCATNNQPCAGMSLSLSPLSSSSNLDSTQSYNTRVQSVVLEPDDTSTDLSSYFDLFSRWSAPSIINFRATPVGQGSIQVTLTWDTDADVDLYIIEPDGNEIYFGEDTSSTGGYLDVDDLDGYGPENIFYETLPPNGTYQVEVNHYSGTTPTNYVVTVSENGQSRSYNGRLLDEDETDEVTTIIVSGGIDTVDTYTVGGSVLGLNGSIQLSLNSNLSQTISDDGEFTFSSSLSDGASYSVAITAQPTGQNCTLSNHIGNIISNDVSSVNVSCSDVETYTVGGSVSGLDGLLELSLNNSSTVSLISDDDFTFDGALNESDYYSVIISSDPSNQTCIISNGSGLIGTEDVSNISVSCEDDIDPNELTISGTVLDENTGLPISGAKVKVELLNSDGDQTESVLTNSSGNYSLGVDVRDLPSRFLAIISEENYIPETYTIDEAESMNWTVNAQLEPLGGNTVVMEIDPSLHHLGDGSFSGSVNSQFQRSTEGTSYSVSFELNSNQLTSSAYKLYITAKGLDFQNFVKMNGATIGFLSSSPFDGPFDIDSISDGSFDTETIAVSMFNLQESNTLQISSVQNVDTDYDDFEFTNVLLKFN